MISPDASSVTLYHSVDEEWEGTTRVELDLEADGDILDQTNVTLTGRIVPVNDQIVQISTIDQQTLIEDGQSLYFNYENYFFDTDVKKNISSSHRPRWILILWERGIACS